jgi:hypothetical protein
VTRLLSPDGKFAISFGDRETTEAERRAQEDVERAIGRLVIVVSVAQTVITKVIVALSDEDECGLVARLKRKPLTDLVGRAVKLVSAKVPLSPEREYIDRELQWLVDASQDFWALRNDLAHGSIYLHGDTQQWAVSRPWSAGAGWQDNRRFISSTEIDRFHSRVWLLVGALSGVVLFPMDTLRPETQAVLLRDRGLGGWYVTVVFGPPSHLKSASP